MISTRKHAAVLFAALAIATVTAFSVRAQLQGRVALSPQATAPPVWSINHNVIVLDPAHGGSDSGAVLGDNILEKDVTLAMALKLKAALTANGFSLISTRDADGTDPLTTDQRAEIANRTHAVACIVLHATATGSGIHVYTSDLQAPSEDIEAPSAYTPIPWETAQAAFVRKSLDLASGLSNALGKNHLPVMVGHVPVRPLDNLMCPAVAIELAPLLAPGVGATAASDANYQQQVANALAGALLAWRDSPDLLSEGATPAAQTTGQAKAIAAADAAGRTAAKVHTSAPYAQKVAQ